MTGTDTIPAAEITAVILAGGRARRMGGHDKGLYAFRGRPLIEHAINALAPQSGRLIISANRNLERYRAFGYPVVTDTPPRYDGPLAGIASAMQAAVTPFVLCAPCDAPFLPDTLAAVLARTLTERQAEICAVHDGLRTQPLCALLRRDLLPGLLAYLDAGGRRVGSWQETRRVALARFANRAEAFANLNTLADVCRYTPAQRRIAG
jgi:molybdopterin-guanine dinucleotide biosynthesis protein A